MLKYFFILLLSGYVLSVRASGTDSLFRVLDKTLEQTTFYMEKKQKQIEVVRRKRDLSHSLIDQYQTNYELSNLYLGYQFDSAYVYGRKSVELAKLLQNSEWQQKAEIHYANVLSSAGLFLEAKEVLDTISTVSPDLSFAYYSSYERLYANLLDYHGRSAFVTLYSKRLQQHYQTAFRSLQPGNPLYVLYAYRDFEIRQQWNEALRMAQEYAELTESGTQPHAVAMGCMAEAYKHLGNVEKRKECLTLSALSDLVSATKENSSLLQLSILLFEEGRVEQAHRYIKYALADANFYNARFRNLQISQTLPIIEQAYQQVAAGYRWNLWCCLICITLLCLFLISIAMKLRGKTTKLTRLQSQLTEQNLDLKHLNEEQQKLVLLQSALNAEIEKRNKELSLLTDKYKEASHVKEEYIGHFLQMCSTYISKLNEYRKTINRKLMAGQYQDLVTFTSSQKYILTEKNELYRQFDVAFLRLYPTFVKQLNALLLPEEQFEQKSGEMLSNELRISALLRLGITDSSRIADFLGYTPATVYTYRTKMRNRAKDRDNFEQDILRIG